MRLFTRISSRANPFPSAFTCIPLCFTEPAPQFEESAKGKREARERCHSVWHSLFTLPFLGVATKASWQSASRFVVPFIASSHLTPPPVLSLPPLACHDSVTLHLHLHAVNCCNSNWTSRPSVYIHTYIYSHIHIIELPVLLFLSSSPSVPVQFRASFCILLSSFWAMLFAFAATWRQATLLAYFTTLCFYWA